MRLPRRLAFALVVAQATSLACNELVDTSPLSSDGGAAPDAGMIGIDGTAAPDQVAPTPLPAPRKCDGTQRTGADAPQCLSFDDDGGATYGFAALVQDGARATIGIGPGFVSGPALAVHLSYEPPNTEAFGTFRIDPQLGPNGTVFTLEADVSVTAARAGHSLLLAAVAAGCGQILGAGVRDGASTEETVFVYGAADEKGGVPIRKNQAFRLTLRVLNARPNQTATETVYVNGKEIANNTVQWTSTCGDLEARVGLIKSDAPSGEAYARFDNVVYWNE